MNIVLKVLLYRWPCVQYLGVNMSSLSMTAFTAERYVAICHPFWSQSSDKALRARRVIVGLWTAGVL
jgi:hypothetical protein